MKIAIVKNEDDRLKDVLILSVSFMLVFTAFITMSNIEQTVLNSIRNDTEGFLGDGYTSLAIIYAVFSFSNWIAPSIIAVLDSKTTMIISAALYAIFIASFLYPLTWLLYLMSVILGLAAATLWTAQGNYYTSLQTKETSARNSGLFWAILQSAAFFGNGFVFWQFRGKTHIDKDTRTVVFSVLTAVGVVGVVGLFLLPKPKSREVESDNKGPAPSRLSEATSALTNSFKMLTQKRMLLLFVMFIYSGASMSFMTGVYSTAIGNTEQFGDAKKLVGLCGVLIGAGEVIGGTIFGIGGSKLAKFGRHPIVILGLIAHIPAYVLVYVNLPNASPIETTNDVSHLQPPLAVIAMFCAFILGFGDACFNTQMYSILGELYPKSEDSASAFALFKFSQSAAAALAFFCSNKLSLRIILTILIVLCVCGTFTFILVELANTKKNKKNKQCPEEVSAEAENEEEEKLKPDLGAQDCA